MKKTILLLAVVAFATSCKKNRTCACTLVETGPGSNGTSVWKFNIKDTKKDAKQTCEQFNYTSTYGGYTDTRTCALD